MADDVPEQHPGQQHPEQQQPHPEHARLYARATRVDDGLPCVLLVIEGDDSWSITGQGQDLPARGVRVPNDAMFLLAKSIVARGRQVGDPGDEHKLAISDEKHTGMQLFIPYCDAQGCSWIGTPHISKAAAQHEGGTQHVNQFKNRRGQTPEREAIPYWSRSDADHRRMAS